MFTMKWLGTVLLLAVTAGDACAAERQLSGDEITSLITDQSLYAGSNAEIEQIFQSNGNTFYIENGSSSRGTWFVKDNQYCSVWPPNPSEACYAVLVEGENVIFVSSSGQRFPMRTSK
jgi:hypothetical protein